MSTELITQESLGSSIRTLGPAVDLRLVEDDGFRAARSTVLQFLSVVGEITNDQELADAVEASASAGFLISGAEKCRKKVKDPYWKAGESIDSFFKDMVAKLVAERARADARIATYERAKLAKQREAEAKAKEEQRRLEMERQQQIAAARQATTTEQRTEALDRAAELRKQAATAMVVPPPPKVQGLTSKPKKVARIIDAELAYKERPHFFELTPKLAVINDAIRGGFNGCPGIVIEEEIDVRTR